MRKIELTKEGKRFLLAAVLIALAALNTGNNLIYLILSMMLSLMVISFAVSIINLMSIYPDIELPEPLYANSPFRMRLHIFNGKFFPSYSLYMVPELDMSDKIYAEKTGPGHNTISVNDISILKRGKYSLKDVVIRTGFPFIFMYANKTVSMRREFIVYPEMVDVEHILEGMESGASGKEALVKGTGGEMFSIREYVYGEESRSIDWKASAKMQKTMVKEYSRHVERLATVILDNGMSESDSAFERSVSIAASLCAELIDRGYYVRLITCKKVVPYGNGKVHLLKVLDILSEIASAGTAECPLSESVEGLSILVVSSDLSGFRKIEGQCSGTVDARNV